MRKKQRRNAVVAAMLAGAAFLSGGARLAHAGEDDGRKFYIIDGDTIAVGRERIRIVGLDAPETADAKCEEERQAGLKAKARLAFILTMACGGNQIEVDCLRIERLPGRDRYGRTLAVIHAFGRDVAGQLIEEGLARPYDCPDGHCPHRAGWCDGRQG